MVSICRCRNSKIEALHFQVEPILGTWNITDLCVMAINMSLNITDLLSTGLETEPMEPRRPSAELLRG